MPQHPPDPRATPAPRPGIDWERIEVDYRAGPLSTREIAGQQVVSHTAINKRARASCPRILWATLWVRPGTVAQGRAAPGSGCRTALVCTIFEQRPVTSADSQTSLHSLECHPPPAAQDALP